MNSKTILFGTASSAMQTETPTQSIVDDLELKRAAAKKARTYDEFISASKGFRKDEGLRLEDPRQFQIMIELLKLQGLNAYRFSLKWDRIMNIDGSINIDGIELYKNQVKMLQSEGIEPIITLHHFDLLDGIEWTSPDIREKFNILAIVVLREFIPLGVKYWIPINEAMVEADSRYLSGLWYPFKHSLPEFFKAIFTMAACSRDFYGIAHDIADEHSTPITVIPALNVANFRIEDENPGPVIKIAEKIVRFIDKRFFLALQRDNIFRETYDAVGIQFYWSRHPIGKSKKKPDSKLSSNGDLLDPEGIYYVIKEIYEIYKKPIFITEWGADIQKLNDHDRRWYIEETFKAIHKAIKEGYPVYAVLNWTIVQNWEIIGRNGGGWDLSNFGVAIPVNRDKKNEPLIVELLGSFETLRLAAIEHGFIHPEDFTEIIDFAYKLVDIWLEEPMAGAVEGLIHQFELLIKHLQEVIILYPQNAAKYQNEIRKVQGLINSINESAGQPELSENVHIEGFIMELAEM